ncbi:MAG: MarR family winged helix-turn-helix transcriptional regulator [Ruminococcus sp.]|jgi:DNA-binding MarR family transcriptional regulator
MREEFQAADLLFMLKKININLEARLEKTLKQRNMSGTQVYFMVYILRKHPEGTYITEMCHEIGISKATLSVLVKKMREKGYLRFQEDPDDIRKKKVVPTERLAEAGEEFLQEAGEMETEIFRTLNARERQQLWKLENKILRGLNETDKEVMV